MKTRDDVVVWLVEVLVDQFAVPKVAIVPQALLTELDLDSIDAIDFAVTLEDKIGVRVEDEELRRLRCFEDMVDLVCGKLPPE